MMIGTITRQRDGTMWLGKAEAHSLHYGTSGCQLQNLLQLAINDFHGYSLRISCCFVLFFITILNCRLNVFTFIIADLV